MTSRFLVILMDSSGILTDAAESHLDTPKGWTSVPDGSVRDWPGPGVVFRPSVFLNVCACGGGLLVFLRTPRQQRDAFLDLTEYESIQESAGRALGAEHATTVGTLTCTRCSTSFPPALMPKLPVVFFFFFIPDFTDLVL